MISIYFALVAVALCVWAAIDEHRDNTGDDQE